MEQTTVDTAHRTAARKAPPLAVVNPEQAQGQQVFTFSFSSGRHSRVRAFMERMDIILLRTVYRPFMRFYPASVERIAIPVPALPAALAGYRMVQMSDFHVGRFVPLRVLEQAVETANSLKPDVIFLTGDFVTNDTEHLAESARALSRLAARDGVYAILGNHDYWVDPADVTGELERNSITVLVNEARQLAGGLWIVGLDDAWSGKPDLAQATAAVPDGATTVLLAHEPDFADQAQGHNIMLQLSGHGHGGQVRVPFNGRPVLPYLSWKYYAGLRRVGDLLLYTNRGLGTMQPPFLFTCRPEVTLLRLERA